MNKNFISDIVDNPKFYKTVVVKPGNWFRKPETIDIQIKGATLRTCKRITLLILEMKNKSLLEGTDQVFDLFSQNIDNLLEIVALAVHNKPDQVPFSLIEAIADNFTNTEIKEIVSEVYRRLDIESFFGSMTYLKDLTMQIGTQETIAKQPLSEIQSSHTS